ncbi:MAG: N-acetylneuraminate synthase, partial [Oscillospiraceae bacterium]|nr:N-acetylneuraminate synthase [Oscillospiraceae bacterium]
GVNHNGNISLAKKMILKAKEAGADYIKFQTFLPEKLVSKKTQKAEYQKQNTGSDESQLAMLKKLALSYEDFIKLKKYCNEVGVGFLSTPFDMESIDFLKSLNMDFWKIPSGEITNLPYLEKIGKTGKRVVLSTGMSEMPEIKAAVKILEENGSNNITLLHCNTEYPTPFKDVNLLAMNTIRKELGKPVGYSDHTPGIEVSVAAAALGASVIEKHFTLDKNMEGPDHKASLEPDELAAMIKSIRNIEQALGNGNKSVSESESGNINIARKSIVAKRDIKKGELLSGENVTVKRPGNGISPMKWYDVIGTKAVKDFCEDELIVNEVK